MSLQSDRITEWLRRQLEARGGRGFVVGVSVGVQSAVVSRLCQMAAPERTLGLLMPCDDAEADAAGTLAAAGQFAVPATIVDLAPACQRLAADLGAALRRPGAGGGGASQGLPLPALASLKARLRQAALHVTGSALGHLVAGTSSRSEILMGYVTKDGDGGSDLLPVGGLLRGQVLTLARELGVPEEIVESASRAALRPAQAEGEDIGVTYADLDRYVSDGPDSVSPALAMRIERLMRGAEHNPTLPPWPGDDD